MIDRDEDGRPTEAKPYNPLEHSVVQACLKADAWQSFECDDLVDALVHSIVSELKRVYWNVKQEQLEDRKDWKFEEIHGFAYRRYFWDDCDCGAESPVHAADCIQITAHEEWNQRRLKALQDPPEDPIRADEIQAAIAVGTREQFIVRNMHRFFVAIHFGGKREHEWLKANPRPECSCGATCTWKPRDHHLETCSPQLPNLSYGEVQINWYKHVGRGMSCNVDWTAEQWKAWHAGCLATLRQWDEDGCKARRKEAESK